MRHYQLKVFLCFSRPQTCFDVKAMSSSHKKQNKTKSTKKQKNTHKRKRKKISVEPSAPSPNRSAPPSGGTEGQVLLEVPGEEGGEAANQLTTPLPTDG